MHVFSWLVLDGGRPSPDSFMHALKLVSGRALFLKKSGPSLVVGARIFPDPVDESATTTLFNCGPVLQLADQGGASSFSPPMSHRETPECQLGNWHGRRGYPRVFRESLNMLEAQAWLRFLGIERGFCSCFVCECARVASSILSGFSASSCRAVQKMRFRGAVPAAHRQAIEMLPAGFWD